jgi:hypothetical protein
MAGQGKGCDYDTLFADGRSEMFQELVNVEDIFVSLPLRFASYMRLSAISTSSSTERGGAEQVSTPILQV